MGASNISNVISTAGSIASTGNAVSSVATTANELGWKPIVLSGLFFVGMAGLICFVKKGIDTGFLGRATKIKENSKIKIIRTDSEEKRKRDQQKHEQKMEEIVKKGEVKKDVASHLASLQNPSINGNADNIDPTMKSLEEIVSEKEVDIKTLQLGYSFIVRGSSLGICGPTDAGKTTLLGQILRSLSMGRQEVSIDTNWNEIKPQKVLWFTTEQSNNDIRLKYKNAKGMGYNLLTETEGMTLDAILAKVQYQLDRADSEGIIVAIDNYTTLSKFFGRKNIEILDRKLTALQVKYQDEKPITFIKVFHTDDNYRAYNPIEEQHIKGSADIANLTKNFVFLTMCRDGENTRIFKVRKNKLYPKKATVSILKYAGTEPDMYIYDREAVEKDVLPLKPVPTKEGEIVEVESIPGKVGRHSEYTDEDILSLNALHDGGTTWREIEEVYGIKRKTIQNRANRIIARNVKEAAI